MWFEISLVRRGLIEAEDLVAGLEMQLRSRPPIGRLAIERGKLSISQLFDVLKKSAGTNEPLGKTAIDLGFITKQDLADLLLLQGDRTLTLSDALVAVGAIDQSVIESEKVRFRRESTDSSDVSFIPVTTTVGAN